MAASNAPDYVPLGLQELRNDLPLSCDLYVDKGGRYVLYRESSLPFTRADCDRLLSSGINHLWAPLSKEGDRSGQRLSMLLALPDEQLPPKAKAQVWYGSAMAIAKRAVVSTIAPETVADLYGLLGSTVSYLARSKSAFHTLVSATLHDHSTYTHAINVAVYSLGVGISTGVSEAGLRDLGLAAFLHDIGKTKIAREVLHKPGPLTAEEWVIMKQHPAWGKDILSTLDELPKDVLTVVSQHHERLDGMGYPRGVARENLHRFSQIVSIVDAFDAMTSDRCYAQARTPFAALSLLRDEVGEKYDPHLFASLVLMLGNPRAVGHA